MEDQRACESSYQQSEHRKTEAELGVPNKAGLLSETRPIYIELYTFNFYM